MHNYLSSLSYSFSFSFSLFFNISLTLLSATMKEMASVVPLQLGTDIQDLLWKKWTKWKSQDGERGPEGDRGRVGELDGGRGELEEMTID
jgi:hypothetical protein